jgi:hypothetical protein
VKITVEHDNGKVEVFQDIADAFLAANQVRHVEADGEIVLMQDMRSWSWGNVRVLLKELRQAVVELEDILRERSRGGSS